MTKAERRRQRLLNAVRWVSRDIDREQYVRAIEDVLDGKPALYQTLREAARRVS
jgi:hypothetical protein